jgi:hypothetical protein
MDFNAKNLMSRSRFHHATQRTSQETPGQVPCVARFASFALLLTLLVVLSACGGSDQNQTQIAGQLAGNWQFTLTPPTDNSFLGGIQGGFLLQDASGTLTGQVTYTVFQPPSGVGAAPTLCNSGSGAVTGSVNGQNVTLTVVASPQTFTLNGTLSSSGTTIIGTYNSTNGNGCGTAQTGLPWTAISIPPLTGSVQGFFHSVLNPTLKNQVFPVTGTFTQGPNIGASNATVTGTLTFQNYQCLSTASVNGQVSGSSVVLQIFSPNGLSAGQIGAPASTTSNPLPVNVLSSAAGIALQGTNGYGVSTSSCPAGVAPGDVGDVCLNVGSATSCTQPVLLSPSPVTFPPQQVGSSASIQTVTLTNNNISTTPLTGLTLSFNPQSGNTSPFGVSDFDGVPNFTEQDTCASSPGAAFNLNPQQSCIITISFSPQQSCPWMPSTALGGEPPSACPYPLSASLTVNSPLSADNDKAFALPISGTGYSAVIPTTPELAFGAEAVGESSEAQQLSFINQGSNPVQILPALGSPCVNPTIGVLTLPRPITPGEVAGLQVVTGIITPEPADTPPTITYFCDSDLTSKLPNFPISNDGCSGTVLAPLQSCTIDITFAPQPSTPLSPALDYFLELNTLQCTSTVTSNCEIDSGRFPVELKANLPSTLRMTPAAGVNFGLVPVGQPSNPLTVTLYNDPKAPNPGTVNFTGNILQGSAFTETDNCSGALAPGSSCTFTVTFLPSKTVFTTGTITVGYTVGQIQTIYLYGTGQE